MSSQFDSVTGNVSLSALARERAYNAEVSTHRRRVVAELEAIRARRSVMLELESRRFAEYGREVAEESDAEMIRRSGADSITGAIQAAVNQARTAEAGHRWLEAGRRYVDALRLAPNNTDARQGLERCQSILVAQVNHEGAVNEVEALTRGQMYDTAAERMERLMASGLDSIELDPRLPGLQLLLAQMNHRQPVTIKFDAQTSYSVSRVLPPTSASQAGEKILELFPGEYVARGHRQGYETVEVPFSVVPGQSTPPILVAATESLAKKYKARDSTAVSWFQRAAEKGFAAAQFNLGLMHRTGRGVKADPIQAYGWWTLAAETGHEEAKIYLNELTKALSSKQLAAAKTRVEQLRIEIKNKTEVR